MSDQSFASQIVLIVIFSTEFGKTSYAHNFGSFWSIIPEFFLHISGADLFQNPKVYKSYKWKWKSYGRSKFPKFNIKEMDLIWLGGIAL